MMTEIPATGRQLRSLVTAEGTLELSLHDVPVPEPGPEEVLVRVEASPINPSDLGLLVAGADLGTAVASGPDDRPVLTAELSAGALRALAGRVGQSLPVGNEGAGTVVAAGASDAAQALLGHRVAAVGGAMYADYRALPVAQTLELPAEASAVDGASSFINPLTALGMVETMRREGHSALVHTAAASNLGQMLNRICLRDGVPLVCVVRRSEPAELLRAAGAEHVCDSSSPAFAEELQAAVAATSATIGFDATGGGTLAGDILAAMEAAATAAAGRSEYSRYGSSMHKQIYIYGTLDRGPTVLHRRFGMAWGVGGWLLFPFLARIGSDAAAALRRRVAAELTTTFASHYGGEVSLPGALRPEAMAEYARMGTGEKYLIRP
jgi:NADPH2:quinone reductase